DKLKLKGIKYFTDPVAAKDLAKDLEFIKNPKKFSNYLKSEYRQINEEDFKKILRKTNLSKEYPPHFEKLSFTMDEFILNSINSLFHVLMILDHKIQIEIKFFL